MKVEVEKPKKSKRKAPKPVKVGLLDTKVPYSLPEAAAHLRTSLPTLHKFIKAGRLKTINEGRRRLVHGSVIASFYK